MPRRLATKLILALAVIVLIAKAIALIVNIRGQEARLVASMNTGADQLSRSITSATWHAMLADLRDNAYEVMHTIAEKQGVTRIRMFNKDGELMFSTRPDEKVHVDDRAAVCNPCHAHATPLVKVDVPSRSRVYRDDDGRRMLSMITPIYNEPSCSQADCHAHPASLSVLGVLDLTIDASQVDDEMGAIRRRTALLMLLEITLIGAFLVFFTRSLIEKPILKLIAGTKAISAMRLDQPITTITSSIELEQLSNSFNAMRERLKEAMEENAQFTQQLETKVAERTAQLTTAQHKLVQADRMASLGQLAASVAHEINNPLSGVLNLSMLMQRVLGDDGIPPDRVADFRKYLGQISTETTRVGRIVSDLLSFSRRARPRRAKADLNTIIRTTVSLVSHKLELNEVSVELDLDDALPQVCCDASQLQQVVLNLVLNGAEAIRDGGLVKVATRVANDRVILTVADDGAGMDPEIIDKIFDPFFTTKEEGKGVGLGLAVVYGIVEAHAGDIDVASEVGRGSTFRVSLPLRPHDQTPAEEEVSAASTE